jgi:hypothetical protein
MPMHTHIIFKEVCLFLKENVFIHTDKVVIRCSLFFRSVGMAVGFIILESYFCVVFVNFITNFPTAGSSL